jgi:hypothetical protein
MEKHMRTQLGWLTFLLKVRFMAGLLLTVLGTIWFTVSDDNALIGFWGFGIPMVLTGIATAWLWDDKTTPLRILGWTSTMAGVVCGASFLLLVAGWVLSTNKPSFAHSLGLIVPMVWCGSFGIFVLYKAEDKPL